MLDRRLTYGFVFLIFFSAVAVRAPAAAQTKLLRFPDLHGDQVVFTYAGDLWLAPADGGTARRLTAHPGVELFAKFSPDGKWIAFTGQYDGDEQVYVVPAAGGMPLQLTYYPAEGPLAPRWGYDNQVYGWAPDGESVLFRSMRDGWSLTDTRLYTVDVEGGLPVSLPMPESGAGDFSPDGSQMVYSPLVRDFRHWKRYQGGWAQDLYIFDLESHEARRITDHPRSDRDPMWIGDRIYFSSDRDGKLNLYVYDTATGETEQLSRSDVWDVRWPSADHATGRIVYELNGELEILDTASGTSRAISIAVPDDGLARRPSRIQVDDFIEDMGLGPQGKRAVFAARGDIFTAPAEHGRIRNLTRTSGAHDREPAWSPDSSKIAFVSDRDGEEEIWLLDQAGQGEPEQLTDGNRGRFYDLAWSPDGNYLAFRNQQGRLFVLDLESRQQVEIADDRVPFGLGYSWSPDGRYLAFSLAGDSTFRSLYIWSSIDRRVRRITGELFHEFSPSWDPQGNYLFFLSDREFAPQIGSFEFNYVVDRETQVYALALRQDTPHPVPPRSDEVEPAAKAESAAGKTKKGEDQRDGGLEQVAIDFDGLASRLSRLPIPADNYAGLAAVEGHLLYVRGAAPYYGRQSDTKPELRIFSLEERKETTLATGLATGAAFFGFAGSGWGSVALSPDGTKVLVALEGKKLQLLDAAPEGRDSSQEVSVAELEVDRVPAQEWSQIFDEVWRRYRDFFYVENMHGYDWQGLRERYRPLLAHVAHRSDLNYVISEMIAELNVSHTYVVGGDWEIPDRPKAGLIGARFELDADSGRYRISEILPGDNAEERYRSPLTEVGVDISVGDYVLEINGRRLEMGVNPFELLRHAGGSVVELVVNDRPMPSGSRRLLVEPIADEDPLLYLRWIEGNRGWVDEESAGRVGYIYLPDMGSDGIREWVKWYYGQRRKQGLIIDVRSNGGGNVSPLIIRRLVQELLLVDFERNTEFAESYPDVTFHGHLVCLLDEDTASDGDQFAWAFRQAGLGPLIGKRSWGGVVGIYGRGPLIDGGLIYVPEAGTADPEGRWIIEGYGVEPDIVVEQDPQEVLKGRDPQLERALEVIVGKIESDPRSLPARPAPPVKTE